MQIKDIFRKDLSRPINGVVKADDQTEAIVWQELDEYVVTTELDKHFRKFFAAYLASLDNPNDSTISGRIGVWVSGLGLIPKPIPIPETRVGWVYPNLRPEKIGYH